MMNMDFKHGTVYSIEEINSLAKKNQAEFLGDCEEEFHGKVRLAVGEILTKAPHGGVIMLAGPSSAGKTTTSMILRRSFEAMGRQAVKVSLDDFFLPAEETPFDENGERDFEGIAALDLSEFKRCLASLARTGQCDMPKFDFKTKRPSPYRQHIQIDDDDFLIIEGLHALNPLLTPKTDEITVVKLLLNIESAVEFDGKICTGQGLRMFRRLVRDTRFRSISVEDCLDLWDNVLDGERKNIIPYAALSDITIDSFHKSEPGIIGARALPMLKTITKDSPHYRMAAQYITLLEQVYKLDRDLLSADSLLTEFVGGGSYEY